LKAVTTTRNRRPTWSLPITYLGRRAPRTLAQDRPARLQDCQAYRKRVGRFDQRPCSAETVCPERKAPAIFGATRLWGARSRPATEVPAKRTTASSSTLVIELDRFTGLTERITVAF
jgi:hypothetical protein